MNRTEMREFVQRVKAGLRITKVVCTRSVKGKMGDTYVGFSAAWNTIQDDGGQGLVTAGSETDEAVSLGGMTLQEATVAACIVALEADVAAFNHALAGGNIGASFHANAVKAIRSNYSQLILGALSDKPTEQTNDKSESNNS